MKAVLGIVSLLVVLGVVSTLAKKQLSAGATQSPQQQSQQIQQQVKLQVEAAVQQARPLPDDK